MRGRRWIGAGCALIALVGIHRGVNWAQVDRGATPAGERVALTGVRFFSSQNYTRVTLDLSGEARYETHSLPSDSSRDLPPRIYIDVQRGRLGLKSTDPVIVRDRLLQQVRVGQFTPEVVRVVLDLTAASEHKAFLLPDPFRLVIDIHRSGVGASSTAAKKAGESSDGAKAKPAVNGQIRKIVIDPGHGGKDPGAVGMGGLAEKDIVLALAKRLARKLRAEMGVQVVLTREDDSFIALEDRTAVANAEEADLFISLHVNASPNPHARGIETYYLDNTNDEGSIRLAARENATSRWAISDLQFILSDLTQNSKLEDSIALAHRLHSSLIVRLGSKERNIKDLGVKKALFYVLVGARMPSVLVELFFVTNRLDARMLSRSAYQEAMVQGLYDGIKKYQESTLVAKNL
jgi:N-acetylmuramoyl-L-alanine amidase